MQQRFIKTFIGFIARHRKNKLVQLLYTACRVFIQGYENKNPDFYVNGEAALLKRFNNKAIQTVFDVGANKGDWSIEACKTLRPQIIYAFEPVEEVFNELVQNTDEYDTRCFNLAFSNQSGEATFYYSKSASYLSSTAVVVNKPDVTTTICKTITGDEFCKQQNISTIDYLKIDTEGNDLNVLRGFEQMLNDGNIKLIQFEYGPFSVNTHDLLADFYQFLESKHFIIGKIYPKNVQFEKYSIQKENFILSNFFAVHESQQHLIQSLL